MASVPDDYDAYYAAKLWALLPAIYQAQDSTVVGQNGPMREIVNRIGAQAAVLRRSIDRTWEDQSIESCDDWVIPYIADLLATRLVSASDPQAQRLDVANTVYYRTRKGTLAVIEELANDITGWNAKVVEFFRRMARAHHGLDPQLGLPGLSPDPTDAYALQDAEQIVGHLTRMPAHGIADLRNPHTARLAGSAFDELSYTADMRFGEGRTGWYNIPRLGVFVWRLKSTLVTGVTPVPFSACSENFTFDPSGRLIPLFAAPTQTYGDTWASPTEQQVPGPISRQLLFTSLADLYATPVSVLTDSYSLGLFTPGTPLSLIPVSNVTPDPVLSDPINTPPDPPDFYIDPQQGVLYRLPTTLPAMPLTAYCYGFSSNIGAGAYDRRVPGQSMPATTSSVSGGGGALSTALGAATGNVVVTIGDSLTYTGVTPPATTVAQLVIQAANNYRPLIRVAVTSPVTLWTFTGSTTSSTLVLDGIWITGCEIEIAGTFDSVTITNCTLDPGNVGTGPSPPLYASAVDGASLNPCRLRITGTVTSLVIQQSITGPIWVESGALVETMTITDSIVQALPSDPAAISSGTLGVIMMQTSTILGPITVQRLEASTCILYGTATVTDLQHSCLRFCAWTQGSTVPKQYESPMLPTLSIFNSTSFGDPTYAQLALSAPSFLFTGAESGSEIGAFSRENGAIKEEGLLLKLQEYMPVGLTPVIIYVT
jgi:hypothetical protein